MSTPAHRRSYCTAPTCAQELKLLWHAVTLLRFTIPYLTELELADMAFSRCGSRLYALSRPNTTSEKQRFCLLHTPRQGNIQKVANLLHVNGATIARWQPYNVCFHSFHEPLPSEAVNCSCRCALTKFAFTLGIRTGGLARLKHCTP